MRIGLKSDVDKLDIDKLKNAPSNLSNLKSKVDKLDDDKLVFVPVDLSKLSDVVKKGLVKKDVYNAKIKNIEDKIPDINNLATNTTDKAKINEIKNEISSITNLATTTALNAKINEVKNKITNITNLATTAALAAVENKIPNVSNLVKKTDCNIKISETENKITTDHDHDKYIATQELNKLTSEIFTARLAQANLASKSDIANFVKKTDFDDKLKILTKNVTSNKAKHVLVENELNELLDKVKAISTKGLTKSLVNKFSILKGAKYFSSGIFQNHLVFIPAKKYFKHFSGTTRIDSWKSNGILEETLHQLLLIIMYYQT